MEVEVLATEGAGCELAANKAHAAIVRQKPARIILMTGICDLTWRDKRSKVTKLRYSEVKECVDRVMEAIRAACEILDNMGNHKVSIATITGIDLADYNLKKRRHMMGGRV